MSKQAEYIKSFNEHADAVEWARVKTNAHAKGDRELFVVTEGPEDNWIVCDLRTGIDLGIPYSWSV